VNRALSILSFNEWEKVDWIIQKNSELGVGTISIAEYPSVLKELFDAPIVLYYRGDIELLSSKLMLAVVGTRSMSPYGKSVVARLVPPLAESGFTIVSGMARGIDGEAHRKTLDSGGKTIAVLPSPFDNIYPQLHSDLYYRILEKGGLVVSEYHPGTLMNKYLFVQRNRIIAGLSQGVLVVEGNSKSGSLITASLAEGYGRDVFAVPGPVTSELSTGVNELMKRGAIITTDAKDIFEHYSLIFKESSYRKKSDLQNARKILGMINPEGSTINDLMDLSGLKMGELLFELEVLESEKRVSKDELGLYFLC
jgi:DNA processing protein